jgi:hypothetical protein
MKTITVFYGDYPQSMKKVEKLTSFLAEKELVQISFRSYDQTVDEIAKYVTEDTVAIIITDFYRKDFFPLFFYLEDEKFPKIFLVSGNTDFSSEKQPISVIGRCHFVKSESLKMYQDND